MAGKAETVTVLHPHGFPVEVSAERAEILLQRGYSKPKPQRKTAEK